jgi:hypothetical protein
MSNQENNPLSDLAFLLGSFTDNGRSMRSFVSNPQELSITILVTGLLSNSRWAMDPEDAIKTAFVIHEKIQKEVQNYQSMKFVSNVENCFKHPELTEE